MGQITNISVLSSLPCGLVQSGGYSEFRDAHLHLAVTKIPHPNREELIREAAYHRAEARGFAAGHELQDWLAAEAEVNERMNGEGRAY